MEEGRWGGGGGYVEEGRWRRGDGGGEGLRRTRVECDHFVVSLPAMSIHSLHLGEKGRNGWMEEGGEGAEKGEDK